jgi:hypothetical protein
MHIDPSLLWTWNRTIDRAPYVLTGILLMFVKFGLDWTLASVVFDRPWSPFNYLIWPDDAALRVLDLSMADRLFTLTLLLVSLPFMRTGVMLTVHRLRAVQLPVALVVLFFVPLLNLFLFFVLSFTPTRNPIPGKRALLVPLENPEEVVDGRAAKLGTPILLPLGGLGVRNIEYFEARRWTGRIARKQNRRRQVSEASG